jgi:hypothetical protein
LDRHHHPRSAHHEEKQYNENSVHHEEPANTEDAAHKKGAHEEGNVRQGTPDHEPTIAPSMEMDELDEEATVEEIKKGDSTDQDQLRQPSRLQNFPPVFFTFRIRMVPPAEVNIIKVFIRICYTCIDLLGQFRQHLFFAVLKDQFV